MRTSETIKAEIVELNKAYSTGALRVSNKDYMKKYNSLARAHKKAMNQELGRQTLSDLIKDFGAKVTREYAGLYTYHGVNFTADFMESACETVWWEVDVYMEGVDEKVFEEFEGYNYFDRKSDVLLAIFSFDQRLSEGEM